MQFRLRVKEDETKKLLKRIEKLPQELQERVFWKATGEAGFWLKGEVLINMPWKTGAMAGNLRLWKQGANPLFRGKINPGHVVAISTAGLEDYYPTFVELGWTKRARRPIFGGSPNATDTEIPGVRFMRETLFNNSEKIFSIARKRMAAELARLTRG